MRRTTLNQMGARDWVTPWKIWRNSIITMGTWEFWVDSFSFGMKKRGRRRRTVVVMIMVGSNRAVFLRVYCVPGAQYQCWAGKLRNLPVVDTPKLSAADSWDPWRPPNCSQTLFCPLHDPAHVLFPKWKLPGLGPQSFFFTCSLAQYLNLI